MKVEITEEFGYNSAMLGISMNKRRGIMREPVSERANRIERAAPVAKRLAGKGHGHDKALRMMRICVLVEAPLYWWGHMDQYKIDKNQQEEPDLVDLIAGDDGEIVTSSESLMNSIPAAFVAEDFEGPMSERELYELNCWVDAYKRGEITIDILRGKIPQSVKQARMLEMNYATLWNICIARANHGLPQWHYFIDAILEQVQHPELLPGG